MVARCRVAVLAATCLIMPLTAACGTTTPNAAVLDCARVNLPARQDVKRVRCPDGVQRYAAEGEYVSLGDICRVYPASREEATLAEGATCSYGGTEHARTASRFVGDPNTDVTLEVIRR